MNAMKRLLESVARPITIAWLLLLVLPVGWAQTSGASGGNPYTQVAPGVNQNGGNSGGIGAQGPGGIVSPGMQTMGVQQGVNSQNAMVLYPDPKVYMLAAGDLMNIRLFGSADYMTEQRISKDGTIELPLIGSVNLAGITIRDAEQLIDTRLRLAGMYKDPQIMITIAESASPLTITLTGEMHGVYPIQGQRPLLDVLASFGGLPSSAGRTVTIIRPGEEKPILVDLGTTAQDLVKANVPIYPHDTIFVERAGVVYVVGAFKQQGIYPLTAGRVTLMQMAAASGGPLYAGKYDDMRIIRTVGTDRTEVKVDIKKVLYGQAPDPILQAGDILFLPPSQYKALISNGNLNTLLSVVSILIFAIR